MWGCDGLCGPVVLCTGRGCECDLGCFEVLKWSCCWRADGEIVWFILCFVELFVYLCAMMMFGIAMVSAFVGCAFGIFVGWILFDVCGEEKVSENPTCSRRKKGYRYDD